MVLSLSNLFRLLNSKLPEVDGNPSCSPKAMQGQFKCKHKQVFCVSIWTARLSCKILSMCNDEKTLYILLSSYFLKSQSVAIAFHKVSGFLFGDRVVVIDLSSSKCSRPGFFHSLPILSKMRKKKRESVTVEM